MSDSRIKSTSGSSQDILSLSEKPKANAKSSRDPKKLEAAKMFENQFIRQMISQMRKTIPEGGLLEDSQVTKLFQGQLDDHYADQWVDQGGIGLSDVIYEQLEQKLAAKNVDRPFKNDEMVPLKNDSISNHQSSLPKKSESVSDLFSQRDKDLFLIKKTTQGFQVKSKEPLPENVNILSPLQGRVLQAASLGEGKQMIIVEHDLSPELGGKKFQTHYVHTGANLVQQSDQIQAGQAIASLRSSRQGEFASVVFGLRKPPSIE